MNEVSAHLKEQCFTPFWMNSVLHYLCWQCLSFTLYDCMIDISQWDAHDVMPVNSVSHRQNIASSLSDCHATSPDMSCQWTVFHMSAEQCFISEWLPCHITWHVMPVNSVSHVSRTVLHLWVTAMPHHLRESMKSVSQPADEQHLTQSGEHCQCNTEHFTLVNTVSITQSIWHYLVNTVSITQYITKFHLYMLYLKNVPQHPVNVTSHCLSSMKNVPQHPVNVTSHCLSSMKNVPQHPVNVTSHCLT